MSRPWTCIQTDSVRLEAGITQATIFDNKDPGNDPVLAQAEQTLVKSIQRDQGQFEVLIEECGFAAPKFCFTNVPRNLLDPHRKEGDLDMVLGSHSDPPEIALLEFKRIKIKALDTYKDKQNKINGVSTLFHQIRERLSIGFSAVCGIIIVHGDLGNRESPNTILRNYTEESSNMLWEKISSELTGFPSEAGLVLVKFNHPTTEFKRTNFCALRLQAATKLKQSGRITDSFRDFVTSGQASNYA